MFDPTQAFSFSWKVTTASLPFDIGIDEFHFVTVPGGSCPAFTATPTPNPILIDDVEDGDNQISIVNGRNGYWSTAADAIGSTVGTASGTTVFGDTSPGVGLGGTGTSSYCAQITGVLTNPSGANYPFAAVQANFVTVGGYDASGYGYTGVRFDIKANLTGPCFAPYVRFQMVDGTTLTSADANGVNLTLPQGAWTPVTVFFNQMMTTGRSGGVTQTHVLDLTTLQNVQWQVTYPGITYSVSVDNVQFVSTGAPAAAVPPSWPNNLIDNGELGVNNTLYVANRGGGPWFTFDNASMDTVCPTAGSAFIMNPGGNALSPLYAARMTGIMGAGGYPGMGCHFLPSDASNFDQIYNITTSPGGPYTGFQFYAKFGTAGTIAVMGADATTDPNTAAPTCANGGTGGTNICNANHVYMVPVTTSWAQYQVAFTSMVNPSWNTNNPQLTFKASQAVGIQWQIGTAGAYDFWVDDISFY